MPKAIGVKIPEPMLLRLTSLMEKEDKDNRNAVICELIDLALSIRESGKGVNGRDKINELVETCDTRITLQMNRVLCEVLRFTYDGQKSKYPECKDAESLLKKCGQLAQQTVEEYKGVEHHTEV